MLILSATRLNPPRYLWIDLLEFLIQFRLGTSQRSRILSNTNKGGASSRINDTSNNTHHHGTNEEGGKRNQNHIALHHVHLTLELDVAPHTSNECTGKSNSDGAHAKNSADQGVVDDGIHTTGFDQIPRVFGSLTEGFTIDSNLNVGILVD